MFLVNTLLHFTSCVLQSTHLFAGNLVVQYVSVQLNGRWTKFLSVTVPFVTRVVKDYTSGNIMKNEASLARDLRIVIEKLGPTFIKVRVIRSR